MKAPQPPERYIVPARQLSGTRDEVLAQIDELILGLTGLRQLVSMHGPKPAEAPPRKLRLVRGFLKVLLLLGIALWASPVLPLRAYDTRANTFAFPDGWEASICDAARTRRSSAGCGGSATSRAPGRRCEVLLLGMIVLGIVTFAALIGFITLCDRV